MIANNKSSRVHLIYIVEEGQRLIGQAERTKYYNDYIYREGVIRVMATVCESASKLTPEIQNQRKEIDWVKIKSFRNVLIHEYMGAVIDIDVVWDLLNKDFKELVNACEDLLNKNFKEK